MNFYLLSSKHWWKIMRITFSQLLIALILSGVSFAKSLAAQDVLQRQISITVANSTLETTLKKLEKDASVKFVYSKNIVHTEQKITFASTGLDLKDVLDKLLTPNGILYRVINDHIVLNASQQYLDQKKIEAEKIAQAEAAINVYVVKGKVTDESGPLPGVNVKLKGAQTTGTVTDANGNYTLSIPDGTGTLEFSFIGYATQEVAVAGRSTVDVVLAPNAKALNEVVVIGYGTQKASNVTGAVATLKNENLDERAVTRVDQALVGQLAGVTVKETSGMPGKAFSIQVRGTGSISAGNEPLYVIDGFPLTNNSSNTSNGSFTGGNPLDNINPSDIESIEVLKDAAAAAIYGSRASNGVVIITTKHGKSGKTKINFNTYAGYNQASKQLPMLDGDQWIARATEMINASYVQTYGSKGATAADNNATRAAIIGSAFNANYELDPRWAIPGHPGLEYQNWQNDIERKGVMMNDEISASGGNDNVTYFMSGNYSNQDGFIMNTGYKVYSARANVDIQATKKFKIGIDLSPSYSISEDPGVEGKDNIFHQALSMSPIQEDSVGQLANIGKNAQYLWSNTTNSPVGKLMYNIGETKKFRNLATVFGEYEIIKGLTFKSSLNLDVSISNTNGYVPYITTGMQSTRTFNAQTNPNPLSSTSASYSNYRRLTYVNENTLTYNTVIHNDHSLNILIGESYNYDRLDQTSLSSSGGFTSATIQTLSSALATTGSTSATQNVLESYFSRVQYSYKDKYLLSASLRTDGSSRFGGDNQFGIFPSASLGWRVIQENFMKKYPAVSDLKLRVSYGVNGNNNIGDYGSISQLGTYSYVLNSPQAGATGQAPSNVANPNLQWEKSQTWDGGIDMGFLNNRITASFDYYNKLSTQLLLNVPVPETTGFSSALQNAGSVRNIGEELEITTRNIVGKFEWSTAFNVSHNTNKIVSLYGNQKIIVIPNSFDVSDAVLQVGQPLYAIYALKYNGFLTAADIANKVPLYSSEQPGDPKFVDANHDNVISEADKQVVGHPNPDYIWGVTNTFKFKGFDLSVLIQGQDGGSIYSELGRAISRAGQGFTDNEPETFVDRWYSPTNQGAGRFGKAFSNYNAPITATTDWLYSSNYFRVRDITLGYNLKNIVKTPVISAARIYVTAENFFGHDDYTGGLNPEAANTSISGSSAYPEAGDYGGLPLAKSLIFGLNFTF